MRRSCSDFATTRNDGRGGLVPRFVQPIHNGFGIGFVQRGGDSLKRRCMVIFIRQLKPMYNSMACDEQKLKGSRSAARLFLS